MSSSFSRRRVQQAAGVVTAATAVPTVLSRQAQGPVAPVWPDIGVAAHRSTLVRSGWPRAGGWTTRAGRWPTCGS